MPTKRKKTVLGQIQRLITISQHGLVEGFQNENAFNQLINFVLFFSSLLFIVIFGGGEKKGNSKNLYKNIVVFVLDELEKKKYAHVQYTHSINFINFTCDALT